MNWKLCPFIFVSVVGQGNWVFTSFTSNTLHYTKTSEDEEFPRKKGCDVWLFLLFLSFVISKFSLARSLYFNRIQDYGANLISAFFWLLFFRYFLQTHIPTWNFFFYYYSDLITITSYYYFALSLYFFFTLLLYTTIVLLMWVKMKTFLLLLEIKETSSINIYYNKYPMYLNYTLPPRKFHIVTESR